MRINGLYGRQLPARRRRGTAVGAIAAASSLGAALLGTPSAGAEVSATSISTCGTVTPSPPAVVRQGASESNTSVQAFAERTNYTLPSSIPVDVTQPRSYPHAIRVPDQLAPGSINSGTAVDSYLLLTDPVGQPSHYVFYQQTFTFTTPILGLILTTSTLNSTDSAVGSPTSTYDEQAKRGLELNRSDVVTWDAPNQISVNLETSTDTDQIRVITANSSSAVCSAPVQHYTMIATDGGVFPYHTPFYGSMGGTPLNKPVISGAYDDVTTGYWEAATDGGVFTFHAPYFGSTGNIALNKPIIAMAPTATDEGYTLFATDGGVFTFGDAVFEGSLGSTHLNQPIVGASGVPFGVGYWMVASDGGVFNFGDAGFYGSLGSVHLNQPIVGIATTSDGLGYWMVASDGGVFHFGDAGFYGSTGNIHLNKPIVAMKPTPDGKGYWLFASDGGVFTFGDASFYGSLGAVHLNKPIVDGF